MAPGTFTGPGVVLSGARPFGIDLSVRGSAMAKRDFYEVLGVQREATEDDLKKAYRKQAMKYHPDRNQGDKEAEGRFKELNEAYDVLKDGEKRAAYDRYGHAAFDGGTGGGAGAGAGGGPFGGFEDIFEEMFGRFGGGAGGRRQRQASGRGADLRTSIEIGLDEAFAGAKKTISVPSSISRRTQKSSQPGSSRSIANGGTPTLTGRPPPPSRPPWVSDTGHTRPDSARSGPSRSSAGSGRAPGRDR